MYGSGKPYTTGETATKERLSTPSWHLVPFHSWVRIAFLILIPSVSPRPRRRRTHLIPASCSAVTASHLLMTLAPPLVHHRLFLHRFLFLHLRGCVRNTLLTMDLSRYSDVYKLHPLLSWSACRH